MYSGIPSGASPTSARCSSCAFFFFHTSSTTSWSPLPHRRLTSRCFPAHRRWAARRRPRPSLEERPRRTGPALLCEVGVELAERAADRPTRATDPVRGRAASSPPPCAAVPSFSIRRPTPSAVVASFARPPSRGAACGSPSRQQSRASGSRSRPRRRASARARGSARGDPWRRRGAASCWSTACCFA